LEQKGEAKKQATLQNITENLKHKSTTLSALAPFNMLEITTNLAVISNALKLQERVTSDSREKARLVGWKGEKCTRGMHV
jgi:hypothetical protein